MFTSTIIFCIINKKHIGDFMKKILIIAFCFFEILFLGGCSSITSSNSDNSEITVNLPSDNTVNGYRKEFNNSSEETYSDTVDENKNFEYCGNKNTKKFHKSDCYVLKNTKDENKVYCETRAEFITEGYSPCKICNP